MKIEFIRKYKGKEIGTIEDVANRVGHRFITRGMAKEVVKIKKPKKKSKKKIW